MDLFFNLDEIQSKSMNSNLDSTKCPSWTFKIVQEVKVVQNSITDFCRQIHTCSHLLITLLSIAKLHCCKSPIYRAKTGLTSRVFTKL